MKRRLLIFFLFLSLLSCSGPEFRRIGGNMEYASLVSVSPGQIVSICPYDGSRDTLRVSEPLGRIVCMSTSHVAYLDALGCDSVICGVSGAAFVSSPGVAGRIADGLVFDVGYDQAPDYERIVSLQPDVVLAYRVSAADSPFLNKLASLGVRVFSLYEFLEEHPLGRAEYLKVFGAITGRKQLADSLFSSIVNNYNSIVYNQKNDKSLSENHGQCRSTCHSSEISDHCCSSDSLNQNNRSLSENYGQCRSTCHSDSTGGCTKKVEAGRMGVGRRVRVLMNIPYGDIWYVPGGESYMARLVGDAGGEICGAREGEVQSSTISLEEAFVLSGEADCWLNTGWCRTREDLNGANPVFGNIGIKYIYNNVKRTSTGGGNDFWESGYVRPDLILKDLRLIFDAVAQKNAVPKDSLHYYLEIK